MSELIQIVPNMKPVVCGIGDYAERLGAVMAQQAEINSYFFVAGVDVRMEASQAVLARLPNQGTAAAEVLAERISGSGGRDILLHYEPYGYAADGKPTWLVGAMKQLKRLQPSCRIGLYVHEVGNAGRPWSRSFWRWPVQRRVLKGLLQQVDWWATSCNANAAAVRRVSGCPAPAFVLPVTSNVGEPDRVLGFNERKPQIVIFGAANRRQRFYRDYARLLPEWMAQQQVDSVIDVGPSIAVKGENYNLAIQARGVLADAAVGELLHVSRYGAIATGAAWLAKSGVFAAYAAHGVCPVVFTDHVAAADGLVPDQHYVYANGAQADPEPVGLAAHGWYGAHRLPVHAARVIEQLSL